jgi:hypothetical protein
LAQCALATTAINDSCFVENDKRLAVTAIKQTEKSLLSKNMPSASILPMEQYGDIGPFLDNDL